MGHDDAPENPPVVVRREPSGEQGQPCCLSLAQPAPFAGPPSIRPGNPPYCSRFVGSPKCTETPEQCTKPIGDGSPIGRRKPRHRFSVRFWGETEGAGAHVESIDDDELPHGGRPDPSEHFDGFGGHH